MKAKSTSFLTRTRVRSKDQESFTNNLASLLGAGVSITSALESLQSNSPRGIKKLLEQMIVSIDNGEGLATALEASGMVSRQTIALAHLGEESGNLVENLKLGAKQEEKQRIFASKVRSALLYPSFVFGLTGVVGIGVLWFLLPRISQTFTQLQMELPLITRYLISLGNFLSVHGKIVIPMLALFIFVTFVFLFGTKAGKLITQKLIMNIPGISRLLHEVEIARFGYLFSTLLGAGLGVTQSLRLLQSSTTSPNYQSLYKSLESSIDEGYDFKNAFSRYPRSTNLLPPTVQQIIIAGELSGSLVESLASIGENYQEKSDVTTRNLEVILEPILLLIVWVGVLTVAVAVILPIYQLVGGLNG